MWNDEIKQSIIKELKGQFDTITPTATSAENHSYADSIFSDTTTNLFRPLDANTFEVPNYFETTITRTRTIKEIPVHTLAFADSFEPKVATNVSFAYSPTSSYTLRDDVLKEPEEKQSYDMDNIINSSNAITISLTPEQRGVAIAKKATWKEILFEDASLIKQTNFAETMKKICNVQIKF